MSKSIAFVVVAAVVALVSCSQGGVPAQGQTPAQPQIVGVNFRDDGRKTVLVQNPDQTLRMCELKSGTDGGLRWDCVNLPALP